MPFSKLDDACALVVIDLLCGRPHKRSSVAHDVMWRRYPGRSLSGLFTSGKRHIIRSASTGRSSAYWISSYRQATWNRIGYLASNRDSFSPSKYASLPGTHDNIVPVPLPITSSSVRSRSSSRPSRLILSEIAQQVCPAPLDFRNREIWAIP